MIITITSITTIVRIISAVIMISSSTSFIICRPSQPLQSAGAGSFRCRSGKEEREEERGREEVEEAPVASSSPTGADRTKAAEEEFLRALDDF